MPSPENHSLQEEKEISTDSIKITIPPYLKKIGWQTWCVIAIIVIMAGFEYYEFSQYKQLPSPLYGGDVYYHFGVINHINNGNSPLMNSNFLGEYAHYPWMSHLLTVLFGKITGLDILSATIFFPMLTTFFSIIITFVLGKKIFEDASIALLLATYMATFNIPHNAAGPFAQMVGFPLFFLAFIHAIHKPTIRSRLFAGLALGIASLSHVVMVIAGCLLIGIYLIYTVLINHTKFASGKFAIYNLHQIRHTIISQIKWVLPIILIGIPIALLFWGPGLFVYHSQTPNRWAEYVASGDELTLEKTGSLIWNGFINTTSLFSIIFSIGLIYGAILLFRYPRTYPEILLLFITTWIGFLHPLITLPLFHTSLASYAFGYVSALTNPLVFLVSVKIIYQSLPQNYYKHIFFGVIGVLILVNGYHVAHTYDIDRWTEEGRRSNGLLENARKIIDEPSEDEAFLVSHEESGFALTAMTGKKVTIARRTHASPFVDLNHRVADTAVMLYGNNETLVRQLLKTYHVTYYYEDQYSMQNQAVCVQGWTVFNQTQQNMDATYNCLRTNGSYITYLTQNGIDVLPVRVRLDPASTVAPLFTMYAIKPKNYTTFGQNARILNELNTPNGIAQRFVQLAET